MSRSNYPSRPPSRMQDIKNTSKNAPAKPSPFPKSSKSSAANPPHPTHLPPNPESELVQLRQALSEAIDENQTLRDRVVEMQALMAAAQEDYEQLQLKYQRDVAMLERACRERRRPFASEDGRTRSL